MCGNFGLLLLQQGHVASNEGLSATATDPVSAGLDGSVHAVMQRVAAGNGLRMSEGEIDGASSHAAQMSGVGIADINTASNKDSKERSDILGVLAMLESQTANTELRGGQAGGFSSILYPPTGAPLHTRVRCVARKRYPLSRDLASMFKSQCTATNSDTISVIGHTRFATSSVNVVPELHPHEWCAFQRDSVWRFSHTSQRFEKSGEVMCGLHLTHNGDFDALQMYGETVTVNNVGLWLEKVLHVPNLLRGDSPKLAGCMELFLVQGRWNRAARLAWVRTILSASGDVCEGPLTREAKVCRAHVNF